jgi:hypothetical protein
MVTPKETAMIRLARGLAGLQRDEFGSVHFRLSRLARSVVRGTERSPGKGAIGNGP